MRKILIILSLLFISGCVSYEEPKLNKDDKIKTSADLKIMTKNDKEITFIYPWSLSLDYLKPTKNPEWLNTAKKHCETLKKNTYYAYQPRNFGPDIYDIGTETGSDGKDRLVVRFICAKDKSDVTKILNNDRLNRHYWYKDSKLYIYEFNRKISAQEIAENKAKAEQERLAKIEKEKKLAEIARKQKLASLELSYSEVCTDGMFKKGFVKGTKEYEQCLFDKDREAIAKQKALDEKLAKMTPVQRREFNCENAFKFKPGTNDFNQCVFKLYTTELELEKLELQKQVALANERAAKAQAKAAENEKARADAVAKAQIAAADAQKAAANSASLANSISLMQLGSSMMSGSSSSSSGMNSMGRVRTTCRNVGGFLNCY